MDVIITKADLAKAFQKQTGIPTYLTDTKGHYVNIETGAGYSSKTQPKGIVVQTTTQELYRYSGGGSSKSSKTSTTKTTQPTQPTTTQPTQPTQQPITEQSTSTQQPTTTTTQPSSTQLPTTQQSPPGYFYHLGAYYPLAGMMTTKQGIVLAPTATQPSQQLPPQLITSGFDPLNAFRKVQSQTTPEKPAIIEIPLLSKWTKGKVGIPTGEFGKLPELNVKVVGWIEKGQSWIKTKSIELTEKYKIPGIITYPSGFASNIVFGVSKFVLEKPYTAGAMIAAPFVLPSAVSGAGMIGLGGYTGVQASKTYIPEIKSAKGAKREFLIGEFAGEIFMSGAMIWGGTAAIYPKVSGFVRTIGKEYIPPEKIIEPSIIKGAKEFPTAPPSTHLKQFLESRYKLPGRYEPAGFHAAPQPFAKTTTTQPGSSELPGLYVAPSLSPHFLKVSGEYKPSLSLKALFPKLSEPTALYVEPKAFAKTPKGLKGEALYNWFLKEAQKGKAYVPGIKTEIEAIVPPGTTLIRTQYKYYTKWKGTRIPIYEYKATKPTGTGEILTMRQLKTYSESLYSEKTISSLTILKGTPSYQQSYKTQQYIYQPIYPPLKNYYPITSYKPQPYYPTPKPYYPPSKPYYPPSQPYYPTPKPYYPTPPKSEYPTSPKPYYPTPPKPYYPTPSKPQQTLITKQTFNFRFKETIKKIYQPKPRKYEYKPSLAGFFQPTIKRAPKGKLTGLEIRPFIQAPKIKISLI